ncbi:hypothetical protein [Nocardia alni]|uniref:hypothetical protein n=1 Tax=Nocardia alni TaxID=2815723 RepID=UPI001C215FA4|nr:hypothetical protein [Nocardia alni]
MHLPDYALVSEVESCFTYSLRPTRHARVHGMVTASVVAAVEPERSSQEVAGTPWLRVAMSPPYLPEGAGEPLPCPDPLMVNGRVVPPSFCHVRLHRLGNTAPITVLGITGHPRVSFPAVGLTDAAKRTLGDLFGVLAHELMTDVRAAGAMFDDAQERLACAIDAYKSTVTGLRAEIAALTAVRDERADILTHALSGEAAAG